MPTYTNSGTSVQYADGIRIDPGQVLSTTEWLTTLPTDVTLTTVAPVFNPVVSSTKLTATETVLVPETLTGNYKIRVYVASGDVTVAVNQQYPGVLVGLYDSFEVQCLSRTVHAIDVVISSGTAYVTISKV